MPRKAFTLIELLITISIIAILAAIASISYAGTQARGRDAQRKSDLNQIKINLTTYYYAQAPTQYVAATSKITLNDTTDALTVAMKPNYIREVPLDPLNTGNNVYKYQSFLDGNGYNASFKLYATLENKNDTKGWNGGSAWVVDGYIIQND